MDIAFVEEINKFVVIYLDDITVYSRNENEHVSHLRKIFLKCRKYGISLNPKKFKIFHDGRETLKSYYFKGRYKD